MMCETQKIIDDEGLCFECRVESDIPHLVEDKECESNEKCYGWYSTEHHALFCRNRIKGLRMFIPKIDNILLERFLKLVELDEKYLISLSSPQAKKNVPVKPIKIMSEFKRQRIEKCTGAEIIFFNHSLFLHQIDDEHERTWEKRFYRNFYEKIGNQTLFGLPRVIQFFGSYLPAETFLQLLSTHTKTLQISNGKFSPDLEFDDIIKKAPNLEILTVYGDGSNITYDKGWIANLFEYKNGKNMKHLALKPDISTELDIENLVKFVNAKCAKDVRIDIQYVVEYEQLKEKEKKERFDGICKNVKEYYNEVRKNSHLQIGFYGTEVERRFSFKQSKANKKPKASTRVVTKRKRV